LLALLPAAGCHEPRPGGAPLPAPGEELPILHQVSGLHAHEDRPMRLAIRDAATLAQVPLVDVPVNFDEEMLLIVTLGRRLSDQYAVRIDRVWREGGLLKVDYELQVPPPDAPLSPSSPYCIAVLPRCDLNVEGFSPTIPRRRGAMPEFLRSPRDLPGGDTSSRRQPGRAGSGNVRGAGS